MDYRVLAEDFFEKAVLIFNAKKHKNINDAMHGETFALQLIAFRGETDNKIQPSEIGHKMNVSSARIAQTLNSIEKKGWITRDIDLNDRRKIIISLTPEGKKQAENCRKSVIDNAAKMLELLGEDDAEEYVRITGKLADKIKGETHD